MTNKPGTLYKYVGPEYRDKVFQSPHVATLKCSRPNEFNDPYELFLTINFDEEPDVLAFYSDAIGDLPQLPTTCFSRSPIVVPMWAHYTDNHKGFVIEFAEDQLAQEFPKSTFGNVTYSDAPVHDFSELLARAYVIGKPRYTYMLRRGVFAAAYFTKASCWNYEQERRMVADEAEVRVADSLSFFDVPEKCIKSIICGARASEETKIALQTKAEEIECQYLELKIGRSSATPYFVDLNEHSYSFNAAEISQSEFYCESCGEPTGNKEDECSWCRINDSLRSHAASRNPFRILDHIGVLDSYIAGMDRVGNPNFDEDT